MTHPRQSAGQPPFEDAAASAIAAVKGERRRPVLPQPLTPDEKTEADRAATAALICTFCLGYHPLPNTAGCPRLSSFQIDGDGRITGGTFFRGTGWAKGRVVFLADTKEKEEAGA